MPANRKAPESAPFWFQSFSSPAWRPPTGLCPGLGGRPHGGLLQVFARDWVVARMAASYSKNRVFSHYESLNAICSANTFENRPKAVAPKEVRH